MQFLQFCVSAAIWLPLQVRAAAAPAVDIRPILSGANWSENTIIAYPGSEHFVDSTERWTIFDPPTYSAVVTPGTDADVVQAVSTFLALF